MDWMADPRLPVWAALAVIALELVALLVFGGWL